MKYTLEGYKLSFFSVSNEHQEQDVKARHSWLLRVWNNADIDIHGHWKIAICSFWGI